MICAATSLRSACGIDCDPAGIVYFPNYFTYFDSGTNALFLRALGCNKFEMLKQDPHSVYAGGREWRVGADVFPISQTVTGVVLEWPSPCGVAAVRTRMVAASEEPRQRHYIRPGISPRSKPSCRSRFSISWRPTLKPRALRSAVRKAQVLPFPLVPPTWRLGK